jgi:hypothetical protein
MMNWWNCRSTLLDIKQHICLPCFHFVLTDTVAVAVVVSVPFFGDCIFGCGHVMSWRTSITHTIEVTSTKPSHVVLQLCQTKKKNQPYHNCEKFIPRCWKIRYHKWRNVQIIDWKVHVVFQLVPPIAIGKCESLQVND